MTPRSLPYLTLALSLMFLTSVGVKTSLQSAPNPHSIQTTWQDGGGGDPGPGPDGDMM